MFETIVHWMAGILIFAVVYAIGYANGRAAMKTRVRKWIDSDVR